jgi:hypothetical protein
MNNVVYLKFETMMPNHSRGFILGELADMITGYQNTNSKIKVLGGFNSPIGYNVYITTTQQVIDDNGWEDDLYYQCEKTEYHLKLKKR